MISCRVNKVWLSLLVIWMNCGCHYWLCEWGMVVINGFVNEWSLSLLVVYGVWLWHIVHVFGCFRHWLHWVMLWLWVCYYDLCLLQTQETGCTESCYGCECVTMTYVCFRHKRLVALSHVMVVSLLLWLMFASDTRDWLHWVMLWLWVCYYDLCLLHTQETGCTKSCYGCEFVTMTYVCFTHKRLVALSHVMVVSVLLWLMFASDTRDWLHWVMLWLWVCYYDLCLLQTQETGCAESCYGCEFVTMTYVCFTHKRLVVLSHVMVVSLWLWLMFASDTRDWLYWVMLWLWVCYYDLCLLQAQETGCSESCVMVVILWLWLLVSDTRGWLHLVRCKWARTRVRYVSTTVPVWPSYRAHTGTNQSLTNSSVLNTCRQQCLKHLQTAVY